MEEFLKNIITQMVSSPDDVKIVIEESTSTVTVNINVAEADCGTIVGKSGATIKSLRDILTVYLRKHNSDTPMRVFIHVNEDSRKV